jgi:hypothetical protein
VGSKLTRFVQDLRFDIAPDLFSRLALSRLRVNRYVIQADLEWAFFPLIEDLIVQLQQNLQVPTFLRL